MSNLRADKWYTINDGTRSLFESTVAPEVESALKDWAKANVPNAVLIGGMAISFWGLPRHTQDAYFLFATASDIPTEVPGFKKLRAHAFQHNKTHVEIEVLDPDYLKLSHELVSTIIKTSIKKDALLIASKSGLIASKLNRFSRQDQADIETLIKLGNIDMSPYPLTQQQQQNFNSINSSIENQNE